MCSRPDEDAQQRSGSDPPLVLEHPESPHGREGRELSEHDCSFDDTPDNRAPQARREQQHRRAEHAPELQPGGETHECSRLDNAVVTSPQAGEHPEQRHDRLGRVTIDESTVRKPGCHRDRTRDQPDAVGHAQPPEYVQEQRCRRELEHEGERGQVPNGAEEEELQRSGLQDRVRKRFRPGL
jgi:hypothetical protein